jgi:hypothetical protein
MAPGWRMQVDRDRDIDALICEIERARWLYMRYIAIYSASYIARMCDSAS